MESCIGPCWPLIVLMLALPAGAQSATNAQGEMTAATETPNAAASAPADAVGATQTTDTPAAPQGSAAVPQKNAVTAVGRVPAAETVNAPSTVAAADGAALAAHEALQRYRKAQGLTPSLQDPPGGAAKEANNPPSRGPQRLMPRPLMPAAPMDMPARQEVGDEVSVYTGPDGIDVLVLRYGPTRVSEALVQFSGSKHAWEGKIQKLEVKKTAAESLYWLNVQGKRFVALTVAKDGSGRITLPGETQAYPVAYDATLSAQLSPQYFLADYLSRN
ncbi:hypothetical protein Sant_3855 [Sodalis praecaptivus]|uniref:Secreted protein n=2 Tax=Bruguierivoracaceae TaxID=2812006 RepID=W0I216_9GAMM|nr:hypothetical protein Sant_3855 [Sodalis praecaptivus]